MFPHRELSRLAVIVAYPCLCTGIQPAHKELITIHLQDFEGEWPATTIMAMNNVTSIEGSRRSNLGDFGGRRCNSLAHHVGDHPTLVTPEGAGAGRLGVRAIFTAVRVCANHVTTCCEWERSLLRYPLLPCPPLDGLMPCRMVVKRHVCECAHIHLFPIVGIE